MALKNEELITINDLKKCGVHIPSFRSNQIMYRQDTKTAINMNHNACMPFCLDLIKLFQDCPELFYRKKEQIYTDAVININFNDAYYSYKNEERSTYNKKKDKIVTYKRKRGKRLMSQQALHDELYEKGCLIYNRSIKENQEIKENDYHKYFQLKRTSSKSRVNNSLFILDYVKNENGRTYNLYADMINWSRMGVHFPEVKEPKMTKKQQIAFDEINGHNKFDICSLKAYESLSNSSLINTIKINPKHILLLDDVSESVTFKASVTTLKDAKTPHVETVDNYPCEHDMWDGQSLISDTIVPEDYKNKSMFQMRARWLKTNALQTNIQGYLKCRYWKDNWNSAEKDYSAATTKNMFGDEMLLSDVDIITSPDSLKFLKCSKFIDYPEYVPNPNLSDEMNEKRKCFQYWINNLEVDENGLCDFGIVKNEFESQWGRYQQASYQFLNSLDLNESELKEILQSEYDYIEKLKNDLLVFKNHIANNYVSYNKSFILNLLAVNDEAKDTVIFKNHQKTVIDHYIDSLKQGKIKLEDSDYVVIYSSPVDMLKAAYGDVITGDTLPIAEELENDAIEIYCPRYEHMQLLTGWRNPHINAGNILLLQNYKRPEYQYFHLSENICLIKSNTNFVEVAQGADEDGDEFCISSQKTLVQKAKYMVQSGLYPVPINKIDIGKTPRYLNAKQSSFVDGVISDNAIGIICNTAQVCNSKLWDLKNKGASKETLQKVYNASSLCSSLSQIEIDKAKKWFDSNICNISACLKTVYQIKDEHNKMVFETKSLPIRRSSLDNDDIEFIDNLKEQLKRKEISKAEYDEAIKNRLVLVDDTNGVLKVLKICRPYFFSKLSTGTAEQCATLENRWYCPMDILENLLLQIKPKKYVSTVPLSKILTLDKFNSANFDQIKEIFRLTYEYKLKRNALWKDMQGRDYKETKAAEKDLYAELCDKIKKKIITDATIQKIIYLIYIRGKKDSGDKKEINKKEGAFEFIKDDGTTEEIKYSAIGQIVCGALWDTHPDTFKICFYSQQKKSNMVHLRKLHTNETIYDYTIWGDKYKKVYA